jgi:hypothetical protein
MGKGFKQIGKRRDWGGESSGEIKYVGEYSPRDDRVSQRVKDCSGYRPGAKARAV